MQYIKIKAENFNFLDTIKSHGWVCLKPFSWNEDTETLSLVTKIENTKCKLSINYLEENLEVAIDTVSPDNHSHTTEQQIKSMIGRIFRLDEMENRGRILRCPSLFEDILKTVFTTNCTWKNTEMMAENLCSLCDDSFPTPREIVDLGIEALKTKVKLGYRAEYVYEFSKKVIEGQFDLDTWETIDDTQELKEKIRSIKGVGEYSAHHIMMLLGNYSFLPLDSVVEKYLVENYFDGKNDINKKDLPKPFERFGKWKYLIFRYDWEHKRKIKSGY